MIQLIKFLIFGKSCNHEWYKFGSSNTYDGIHKYPIKITYTLICKKMR